MLATAILIALPRRQELPRVEINHCMMVLDQQTQDAIGHSAFIKNTFARTQYYKVKAGKRSWHGLALFGKGTYLELMVPFPGGPPLGMGGIGLSVEKIGSSEVLFERYKKADPQAAGSDDQVSTGKDGKDKPWYHSVSLYAGTNLMTWVMDINEEYYRSEGINVPASKIVSKSAGAKPPKEMGDILEIDATVPADHLEKQSLFFTESGFARRDIGKSRILIGPDVAIRLSPAKPGYRRAVRHVTLALNDHPKEEKVLKLGRSTLKIHTDATADWYFDD